MEQMNGKDAEETAIIAHRERTGQRLPYESLENPLLSRTTSLNLAAMCEPAIMRLIPLAARLGSAITGENDYFYAEWMSSFAKRKEQPSILRGHTVNLFDQAASDRQREARFSALGEVRKGEYQTGSELLALGHVLDTAMVEQYDFMTIGYSFCEDGFAYINGALNLRKSPQREAMAKLWGQLALDDIAPYPDDPEITVISFLSAQVGPNQIKAFGDYILELWEKQS